MSRRVTISRCQYYTGLILGIIVAGIACAGVALLLGIFVFGLRGPYFAIGTLGIAVAAREIVYIFIYFLLFLMIFF